ncbi:MAG: hypothetical protein ACK4UN_10475 [Limisphaerales bacterium]
MADPKKTHPILRYEHVSLGLAKGNGFLLEGIDFVLGSGELLLLEVEEISCMELIGDIAQGLVEPLAGEVVFRGTTWGEMSQDEVDSNRALIGRVFARDCWLHGMDLEGNILLAGRHHGRLGDNELCTRAGHLARLFEMPRVPAMFADQAPPSVLAQAALIRALLGDPKLIIFENPVRKHMHLLPRLLKAVAEARGRGTGILWMERNREIANDPAIHATRHMNLQEFRKEEHGAAV